MPPKQRRVRNSGVQSSEKSLRTLDRTSSAETSQTTIPGLFGTTKVDLNADVLAQTSPSKRRKTSHLRDQPSEIMATGGALGPAQMYDFAPTERNCKINGHASNPIKISDSPVPSPSKDVLNTPRRQNVPSKSGPKKLVVKNLKPASKFDPKRYTEDVWSRLNDALSAIFEERKLPYAMEELYKGVENTCRQGSAATLYDRLRNECDVRLKVQIQTLANEEITCKEDVDVLRAMLRTMSTWTQQMVGTARLVSGNGANRSLEYYTVDILLPRSVISPSLSCTWAAGQLYRRPV